MSRTNLVAAMAFGGAVALYLLLSGSAQVNEDHGRRTDSRGDAGFLAASGAGKFRVVLEAEDYVEIAAPMQRAEGPPFEHDILAGASGGKAVYVGPEKWNDRWKQNRIKGDYRKGHPRASCPGYARYRLRVPRSGEYVLWVRAWWVDDCGNSLEVSIDGSRPVSLTGSTYGRWLWYRLRDIENRPLRISLQQGKEHTLTICNREDDLYFDQILFVDASLPVDPVGIMRHPDTKAGKTVTTKP